MTPKVEFHFDFGSPNAYFAHKVIPGIEQRTGRQVRLRADPAGRHVQARPTTSRRCVAFEDVKAKLDYMKIEIVRFVKKHGAHQVQDEPALPGQHACRSCAARSRPRRMASSPKYADAVFRHMWEDGLKMDDPEVIRTALDAAGLDGARMLARIQDQDVKDKLLKNTEASVARGTFGTPTFFVGNEMFFGKDKLRDVEEEIEAAKHRG